MTSVSKPYSVKVVSETISNNLRTRRSELPIGDYNCKKQHKPERVADHDEVLRATIRWIFQADHT